MKVLTCVVNNLGFIKIQYYTLKKYLKNDYEFIVFNDAKGYPNDTNGGNINLRKDITNLCKELGIKCIEIPNDYHYYKNLNCSSTRSGIGMNFMLRYQLANPDQYLILDSDMFLVDYLDVNERYGNYKTAFYIQDRVFENRIVRYAWMGIIYQDFRKIDDGYLIDWGHNYGVTDCGGLTEAWVNSLLKSDEKYPTSLELDWNKEDDFNTSNVYLFRAIRGHNLTIDNIPNNFKKNERLCEYLKGDNRNINDLIFCEIFDGIFLHYQSGCNWRGEGLEFHKQRTEKLMNILIDENES